MARGRLKITAPTINVPALRPLTARRRRRARTPTTVPTARAAGRGRGHALCTAAKGQWPPPGTPAKFPSYLQPGPQWGIVLGLQGHRAARRGPRRTPPGRANTAAVAGATGSPAGVPLLGLGTGFPSRGAWASRTPPCVGDPFLGPGSLTGTLGVRLLSCAAGLAAGDPLLRTGRCSRQDAQRAVGGPCASLGSLCLGGEVPQGDHSAIAISE